MRHLQKFFLKAALSDGDKLGIGRSSGIRIHGIASGSVWRDFNTRIFHVRGTTPRSSNRLHVTNLTRNAARCTLPRSFFPCCFLLSSRSFSLLSRGTIVCPNRVEISRESFIDDLRERLDVGRRSSLYFGMGDAK